ncbi:MAG TPA: hypothetical protein VE569_00725 [Acidimicrobiia bacterium]|nr:hypothetical protein [Acidimicrobiia bacterium]
MGVLTTQIRPMAFDDMAEVAALEREQPRPWSEKVFTDELSQDNRTYLVVGDPIVAYGGIMVIGDEAHVTNLFVARERRRQGLVSCPVGPLAITANNFRFWQGRRTKSHLTIRRGRGRSQGRKWPLKYTHDLPDRTLGRQLMVALTEAGIDSGARHLSLEVRASKRAARSFYASLGLAPVGVSPGYYGDDDALIMWVHDIDDSAHLESVL